MNSRTKLAFADDCIFQQILIKMLIKRLEIFDLSFTCNDGSEMIEQLASSDELPGICIMDLHMPHMDGITAANEISTRFPSIKIFGYTASKNKNEIEDFKRNGGVHVFSKTNPRSMLDKINLWTYGIDRLNY